MKIDPICKMEIQEGSALTTEFDGEIYYFCTEALRKIFMFDVLHVMEGGSSSICLGLLIKNF